MTAKAGRNVPGFIYLFKSGNYYKIGLSLSPKKRAKTAGRPCADLSLVHSFPTSLMADTERHLHQKFAGKCVKVKGYSREWFLLSKAEVAWLCSLTELTVEANAGPGSAGAAWVRQNGMRQVQVTLTHEQYTAVQEAARIAELPFGKFMAGALATAAEKILEKIRNSA